MALSNCKKCGAVFSRANQSLCMKCLWEEEEEFEKASYWVRANRGKTIDDMSQETGISASLIRKWVRQKRLRLSERSTSSNNKSQMKCRKCGKPITTGNFCDHCKLGLSIAVREGLAAIRKESKESSDLFVRKGMYYRPSPRDNR